VQLVDEGHLRTTAGCRATSSGRPQRHRQSALRWPSWPVAGRGSPSPLQRSGPSTLAHCPRPHSAASSCSGSRSSDSPCDPGRRWSWTDDSRPAAVQPPPVRVEEPVGNSVPTGPGHRRRRPRRAVPRSSSAVTAERLSETTQPNTVNGCGRRPSTLVTRSVAPAILKTEANGDRLTGGSSRSPWKNRLERSRSRTGGRQPPPMSHAPVLQVTEAQPRTRQLVDERARSPVHARLGDRGPSMVACAGRVGRDPAVDMEAAR
jgi:hypothetical protein